MTTPTQHAMRLVHISYVPRDTSLWLCRVWFDLSLVRTASTTIDILMLCLPLLGLQYTPEGHRRSGLSNGAPNSPFLAHSTSVKGEPSSPAEREVSRSPPPAREPLVS